MPEWPSGHIEEFWPTKTKSPKLDAGCQNQHPDWQAADFERQERKTNGLVLGSAGLGLASAAMLGTSFLVVEW